jgi:FkbM family methyltransferase
LTLLHRLRRAFYKADGPYRRARLAEALKSKRWSRPALHAMDSQLDELIGIENGVFLEAGAHDGYTQSNTYFLERFRGWTGVLVEPVPELADKAAKRRPRARVAQCALVAPQQAGSTVPVSFGDLLSHVGEASADSKQAAADQGRTSYTVDVDARTLDDVLDEAGVGTVDLMVLDLEGHEAAALRGLDLDKHPVRWLMIEMLDLERERPAFDKQLADRFEPCGTLSRWDALYRLKP